MKKNTFDRVPVMEDTLGINIAVLLAQAMKTDQNLLSLTWQGITGLVMLEPKQVTLMFSGVIVSAEIYAVPCLNGRLRPLLKCPRAHEGNFQALYFRGGELACRHCHALRYRSNLASGAIDRARLQRDKALAALGGRPGDIVPARPPWAWRQRHMRLGARLANLLDAHYGDLRRRLGRPAA